MSKVNPDLMQVRTFKIWFPLCTQLKDFMDEQAKINKDVVTKFESMEKILENLYGKVIEVGSSICQVFIVMKMLERKVGQIVGRPIGSKVRLSVQSQGPKTAKATQIHLGEMEDHTKETMKIMTEGPEFEMSSHYKGSCCIRQDQRTKPGCEDRKMTQPKNKSMPNIVRKWVPKIATPAKSIDPN
jgi:hypothetical protein